MAIPSLVRAAFVLGVVVVAAATAASVELAITTDHYILKGKVLCLDCHASYDLSGIVVMAKCEKVGKVVTATTAVDGGFEAELPSDECEARLAGGRNQLYASRKDIVAGIVKGVGGSDEIYGISTPLAFCSSCRCRSIGASSTEAEKYCKADAGKFGSSKTFNLPLPPEWGMAPSSYYFPFFPIIGIP
ncbi:uncharacterized protein LOC101219078 [Cucumis sativus]|uniref:Uncharacterized protein n=1 Tax=Cucumis sativus TaxID=3659 RepID=A0A0A0KGW8_CUCSA|nr:uncharacterized protein LOC101219078 [Cucumis sativus]KGN48034.1 hypothetical protein Csa_003447 [Cucumis sativus]